MSTEPGSFQRNLKGNLVGIGCLLALIIALIGIIYPSFSRHGPEPSSEVMCLNNLKQLGTALHIYQSDWDGHMPVLLSMANHAEDGQGWWDSLSRYAKNKRIIHCPRDPSDAVLLADYTKYTVSYSFNRRLSGTKDSAIRKPGEVAALWDTISTDEYCNNVNSDRVWHWGDKDWPKLGDYVAWPKQADRKCENWPALAQPSHDGVNHVVFADGHVKPCRPGEVPRLSPK